MAVRSGADNSTPLSAQVQFSLLSKGPQQRDTQEACAALGIQLIAYSPLVRACYLPKLDL